MPTIGPPPTALAGGALAFLEHNGYVLERGRFFDPTDVEHARPVVVLGADVVDALFPGKDPLGEQV